jgi:hypothetical protein
MVSSTTRKIISLAISLLVVVISLTSIALGASAPTVSTLTRYTPGFAGAPGKMARDTAGNFYVTDFWGKGVVKLDRRGNKIGFIATKGRPSAVAVLPDNRLVVAMSKPVPYVAFYAQQGSAPNVTGEEKAQFGAPTVAHYSPVAITADAAGYIYVLDAGDNSGDMDGFGTIITPASIYRGNVKVYSAAGAFLYEFGNRTYPIKTSTTAGDFKLPQGIAYEKQANQIVVADTQNGRLQYFSAFNGTTCTYVKSVGTTAGLTLPTVGAAVKFMNPVDLAFEYNDSTVLQRVYVAQRGRNQIAVFDPATTYYLMGIDDTTVSGATMKLPTSILFERTGTGVSTAGVVYTSNAATSTAANILALGVDSGTIPVPSSMTMAAVPAISPTSPITVSGTISPAATVTCSVNGGTGVTASGTSTWTASGLVLQTGMNYILCQSTSGAVTTSVEGNTYFGTPATAPTVVISQPSAGLYTNNLSVTVTGTSDTAGATVQLVNSLNSFTITTLTDVNKKWSAVVNLSEGSNLITATAWKQGTNTSAPATVTVVGDITPPNMTGTISFLANGATTNKAVQNLDGVVLETNLSIITVNGVPVPVSARVTMTGNNTYFSIPVTLVRGKNTVTIKAIDLAGNSTTITRGPIGSEIILNPEIPGMTVALPADNSYMTAAGAVTANGTVDPTFTSVVAGGTAVTPAAGSWSTTAMNVSSGFGSYQFTASGGTNATVTEKRTINTGATFEQVAITSPAADLATNASSVLVSGSVPAGSLTPQISVDGAAAINVATYTSASGAFSHTVTLSSQGGHSVKVIAAGGTTAVRNIIYDTVLPDLTIQADSKLMPTSITGTIEPSAKISAITASLGGTPVPIPVSAITFDPYDQMGTVMWHANLAPYAYDAISFTSVDPAGNSTTLSYKQGIPTGDIDGDGVVRLADALAALRHVAGTEAIIDSTKFFNGDVGGLVAGHASRDGIIDITDSVLILNKAYGLLAF